MPWATWSFSLSRLHTVERNCLAMGTGVEELAACLFVQLLPELRYLSWSRRACE
jgi:hypothetical protein